MIVYSSRYQMPRQLRYGEVNTTVPEVVGGTETTIFSGSIAKGVTTGVLIFVVTRILDRWLFSDRK